MFARRIIEGIPIVSIVNIVGFQEEEFTDTVITAECEGCRIGFSGLQNDTGIKNGLGVPDIIIIVVVGKCNRVLTVRIGAVFAALLYARNTEDIENSDSGGIPGSNIAKLIACVECAVLRRELGGMISDHIVEGIAVIQIFLLAEEEFTDAVLTGQVEVCGIVLACLQNVAQAVEQLGIPDIVVVIGINDFDLCAALARIADGIAAVFCQPQLFLFRSRVIIQLCCGNSGSNTVAGAQIAHLHTNIGFGALGSEDDCFFTVCVEEGCVIAVIDVFGLAEEEFAHTMVTGERVTNFILLAHLKVDAGIVNECGVPYVITVSHINNGDRIAVDNIGAIHGVRISCRYSRLADFSGDRIALTDIAELHADIELLALGLKGNFFRAGSIHKGCVITIVQIRGFADEEFAHTVVTSQSEVQIVGFSDFKVDARIVQQLGVPYVVVVAGVGGGDHAVLHAYRAVFRAQQLGILGFRELADICDLSCDAVKETRIADLHADEEFRLEGCKGNASVALLRGKGLVIAHVNILALAEEELANTVFTAEIEADFVLLARCQLQTGVQQNAGAPDIRIGVCVRDDQLITFDLDITGVQHLDIRHGQLNRAVGVAYGRACDHQGKQQGAIGQDIHKALEKNFGFHLTTLLFLVLLINQSSRIKQGRQVLFHGISSC